MPKGHLEVAGTLDLSQFWPAGESDADTVKITVDPEKGFRYQPHPGAATLTSKAFVGATVRGKNGTKPVVDKKNRLTIRLQGLDAPELHYTPQRGGPKTIAEKIKELFRKFNNKYRQHEGETATLALARYLGKPTIIQCKAVTRVDHPNDVFDTYGRFVGNVVVDRKGKEVDINEWLLDAGCALPAFYTSMDIDEIKGLTAIADGARKAKRAICDHFPRDIIKFNAALLYRGKGAVPNPTADKGQFLFPKLFRRQSAWFANSKAGIVKGNFRDYLEAQPDACIVASDFVKQGAHSS